jgi:hypothetical protein
MKDKDKTKDEEVKLVVEGVPEDTADSTSAAQSLTQIIREQAKEEDAPITKNNISLKKIIGGDILMAASVRKQIGVLLLVSVFLIVYIAEGYSYRKYISDIDKLTSTLKDAKYKALSAKSDLTEKTRESQVLDMLRINNDTLLHPSTYPPFIIEVPE